MRMISICGWLRLLDNVDAPRCCWSRSSKVRNKCYLPACLADTVVTNDSCAQVTTLYAKPPVGLIELTGPDLATARIPR